MQVSQDLHLDIKIQLCEHFLKAVILTWCQDDHNLVLYGETHMFSVTQMNEIVSKNPVTLQATIKQDTVLARSTTQTNLGRLVMSHVSVAFRPNAVHTQWQVV